MDWVDGPSQQQRKGNVQSRSVWVIHYSLQTRSLGEGGGGEVGEFSRTPFFFLEALKNENRMINHTESIMSEVMRSLRYKRSSSSD